jgi:hypothetical protein
MSFSIEKMNLRRLMGARVRAAREKNQDFTIEALANTLQLTPSQWIDMEHGQLEMTADQWVRISEQVNVSLESLMDPLSVVGEVRWLRWRGIDQPALSLFELIHPSEAMKKSVTDAEMKIQPWVGLWRWLNQKPEAQAPWQITLLWPVPGTLDEEVEQMGVRTGRALRHQAGPKLSLAHAAENILGIPVGWMTQPDAPAGLEGGFLGVVNDRSVLILRGDLPAGEQPMAVAIGIFKALNIGSRLLPSETMGKIFAQGLIDGFGPTDPIEIGSAPVMWAPTLAVKLHQALDQGHLSVHKAARSLGMNLDMLKAWFVAHGLTPPFDL